MKSSSVAKPTSTAVSDFKMRLQMFIRDVVGSESRAAAVLAARDLLVEKLNKIVL